MQTQICKTCGASNTVYDQYCQKCQGLLEGEFKNGDSDNPPPEPKPDRPFLQNITTRLNILPPWIKIVALAVIFMILLSILLYFVPKPVPTTPITLCLATDLPMNGPVGPVGRDVRNGVALALMQSPLSKMYRGYDLKTFYMDNSNPQKGGSPDPETGVKNIENLLQQKPCPNPIAIIGPYDSSIAAAEIPLAARNQILLLSPSNTATCLTQKSYSEPEICNYDTIHPQGLSNTYARLPGTGADQGYLLADFLLTPPNPKNPGQGGLGAKKIIIVRSEETASVDVSKALLQQLENNGVKPIAIECVKSPEEYDKKASCSLNPSIQAFSTDNMTALVTKIRDQKPDAIFFGGRPDRGASLLRKQLGELGLGQTPFIGPSSFVSNKETLLRTIAPYEANVYAISGADLSTFTSETAATFSAEYQKEFKEPPVIPSVNGYDAANIILQVIQSLIDAGKPVTRESVTQGVLSGTFTGVAGNRIRFDNYGDNIGQHTYVIYRSQQDSEGTWDLQALAQRVV